MGTVLIFISLSASVAGYTLLVHASRKQSGPKYAISVVVFLTEILKLLAGLVMLLHDQQWKCRRCLQMLYKGIIQTPREFLKTSVPSIIYAFQNNLVMVSLSNLDAATFQLTAQLKIFWTAFFMWQLLGRRFSKKRCFALILLCFGEILVHLDVSTRATELPYLNASLGCLTSQNADVIEKIKYLDGKLTKPLQQCLCSSTSDTTKAGDPSYVLGLTTALLVCFGSGFAGVYYERILKLSQCPFWIRNIQLYLSGVLVSGVIVILHNCVEDISKNIFHGFNEITFMIIITSASIGFFTAFVIQYLDNIWKNLASSTSLVMTVLGSAFFFGTPVGPASIVGTILVISVPWLYHTG